eukprot:6109773-Pyramimonas_sp.AAC.1
MVGEYCEGLTRLTVVHACVRAVRGAVDSVTMGGSAGSGPDDRRSGGAGASSVLDSAPGSGGELYHGALHGAPFQDGVSLGAVACQ